METLYLESDEEITSCLEKLKRAEEKEVVLVIPKGATILQSLVNLKLLSKKAKELNKEIALVTGDKIGRNLASQAGLSVYSHLDEKGIKPSRPSLPPPAPLGVVIKTYTPSLERYEEPKPEQPAKRPPLPPQPSFKLSLPSAFWLSLFLSFFLIFLVLFFLLPKATILLSLKTEAFVFPLEFFVKEKAAAVDFENKIIPGRPTELEKEGAKKFPTSGKKNIGGKAKGTIVVINKFTNPDRTGSEFSLKANVEFKDKKTGKVFLSDSGVTVPKLTYDPNTGNPIPGTASLKVTASEPGESYNLGPSSFSIPALGISSVYGESSEAMTGGYDKFVNVLSDEDLKKGESTLSKELVEKAKEELRSKLEKGQKFLEGGIKEEILESKWSPQVGTEANEFELKMKIKISTLLVLEKEYKELLLEALKKSIPSDQQLVSTSSDKIELSLLDYDLPNQTMKLKATVSTQVAFKLNEERLKEEIAKKTKKEGEDYLKGLKEIERAEIKIWPVWLKRLPSPSKIRIKIK